MNSIDLEWSAKENRRSKPVVVDDIPIREATRAEENAYQRQNPPPVETDDLAKKYNFYTADKWGGTQRHYYADFQQKEEVMRATPRKISTRLSDQRTISAVLDLAEMRGWGKIKISGSDSFKKEMWVQAQAKDIEIVGYEPTTADRQEAQRRQPVSAPVEPKASPAPLKPFWQAHIDEATPVPPVRQEANRAMSM